MAKIYTYDNAKVTVQFTKEQYQTAQKMANEKKVSFSRIIRDALDAYIALNTRHNKPI